LASGIEAVLLSGIKVNAYYYVDRDPVAREIAQFRLANLSAKFPDLFPPTAWEAAFYMMAVQQIVRSLQYCDVNNASTDIKIRLVEVPYTCIKGELHIRWVPFDITNEWDEQTDRLPTGEIDWKNIWGDVKHKARSIVSSLSTSVKQDPTAHRYYPVFIRDWAPIEPI
jgi:hypothetical protein